MKRIWTTVIVLWLAGGLQASELFVEAEGFALSGGWTVVTGAFARAASGLGLLSGASGATNGTATAVVRVKDAGHYRIWVRYMSFTQRRGPFSVSVSAGDRELGIGTFDTVCAGVSDRNPAAWEFFEADLPEGDVTLRLSKLEDRNSPGNSRLVDCLLLTMDPAYKPNHLQYGEQTYMRVTLGDGGDGPVYIHIFADHFRSPWYQHYSLGTSGGVASVSVPRQALMTNGQSTGWCSITPLLYQDSGAMLHISGRRSYTNVAKRLRAVFDFATAPDESAIVRTLDIDNAPASLSVFVPPNLLTKENLALLKTDLEIAGETGRIADTMAWPKHGKKPEQFPFFVSEQIQNSFSPRSDAVVARERKTLDYVGFTDDFSRHIGGAWYMISNSYCRPDIDKMKSVIAGKAAAFRAQGGKVEDIVFAELMDEPTGQPLEFMAADAAYGDAFRAWLKGKGLSPADLLVADWDAVRIVTAAQKNEFPALYAYSQRFRTRALGDFMALQRGLLETAYGVCLPTVVNFSDGAVYAGNFYVQGVDYFELLDAINQNAIWGEDWANGSSTYQCGSYNVDLMRAAARDQGQVIGHHLIAHANRKGWDVKLKATSELARGVKVLNNFCYGPSWATHEGGPYWRSHVWYAKPETWTANAAIVREVGAVEDLLMEAMPAPAKVALLYSSSSDIWTVDGNLATGFDRMHTWLALAHAQVPVDILSERQVAAGGLREYQVCYLSGPNLDRAAAKELQKWVQEGGSLWMTAGAAARDAFNRPLGTLDAVLPAVRGECRGLAVFFSSGRGIRLLNALDEVRWGGGRAEVLSVRQALEPRAGAAIVATFTNGSPALVMGPAGKGRVYCAGFLPGLAYIKTALAARYVLEEKGKAEPGALAADAKAMLERSSNPWAYPAEIRDLLLTPVREAGVTPPIRCSAPLVDAVYMTHVKGILVPLANYANKPIDRLVLTVLATQPVARVESARLGPLAFAQRGQAVELALPLDNNDFVKLYYGVPAPASLWKRLFGG